MGLASFLQHAQNDAGTQEAIRRLLERDIPSGDVNAPRRILGEGALGDNGAAPPTRYNTQEPAVAAPIRTNQGAPLDGSSIAPPQRIDPNIPYDDPNVDVPPERVPLAQMVPPTRSLADLGEPPIRNIDPSTGADLNADIGLSVAPKRIDPRQGVSTAGMNDLEKAQAGLRLTQQTSPQSSINMDDPNFIEAGPPHKMSHFKAAGKFFLDRLMHGGGLPGAIEGLIEGGVAPQRYQKLQHDRTEARFQKQVEDATSAQHSQAQIDAENALTQERQAALMPDPANPSRLIKRPPVRAPHEPLKVEVTNPDGSKSWKLSDDYGQTWRDEPTLNSAAPVRDPKNPDIQWVPNPDGSATAFTPDPKSPTGWKHAGLPDKAAPPDRTNQSEEYQTAKTNAERKAKADAAQEAARTYHGKAESYRAQEKAERDAATRAQAQIDAEHQRIASVIASGGAPTSSGVNIKALQGEIAGHKAEAERLRALGQKHGDLEANKTQEYNEFSKPLPAPPVRTKPAGVGADPRAGTLDLRTVTDPAEKQRLKAKYPNARVVE